MLALNRTLKLIGFVCQQLCTLTCSPLHTFAERFVMLRNIFHFILVRWLVAFREQCCHGKCNIWVRSRNCGCLVTWFCYQLIAKPGNKTAAVSWPDPYKCCGLITSNWITAVQICHWIWIVSKSKNNLIDHRSYTWRNLRQLALLWNHHCVCWCPGTIRCQAICRCSDD